MPLFSFANACGINAQLVGIILNRFFRISKFDRSTGAGHLPECLRSTDWYAAEHGPDLPANWQVANPLFQPGGEHNGHRYLTSFLDERIRLYEESIFKPLESRRGCSRLSPYLAWG